MRKGLVVLIAGLLVAAESADVIATDPAGDGFGIGITGVLRRSGILGNGFFRVFAPFRRGIFPAGLIPRCLPARRQGTVPAGLVQPLTGFFQVQQQLGRQRAQRLLPQPFKVGFVDLP